jgi:hypothetical protein
MNLKSAESAINGAWLTGLVVGALSLIRSATALFFSAGYGRSSVYLTFVDVAVLFALAYGVWRKSRICAILLSLYFIYLAVLKTASWVQSGTVPPGILIDVIALLLCLNGVRGTFAYHNIAQASPDGATN